MQENKILWFIPASNSAVATTANVLIILLVAIVILRAFGIDPIGKLVGFIRNENEDTPTTGK